MFSLPMLGIKNAGFLKFSINPHTYTVAGKGADMAKASITASSSATPGLVAFNNPTVIVGLIGLAIAIFFIVKGIRGGVLLSILVTTIIAIFAGVVDLGSIDWHAASLTSSIKDLGQVFGAALGSKGLGSLFADVSRLLVSLWLFSPFH